MSESMQGGIRLSGKSPRVNPELPVISVITVVYNGISLIEKTIRSVTGQTYPNIEYLIVDGGSTDGTPERIRQFESRISFWISEPDKGIYDAMNKGLALATGDFVWFINAGDQIYTADTLQKIFQDPENPSDNRRDALIYYGDTMIVDPEYREIGLRRLRPPEVLTAKSFRKGMLVCHQAILVARSIARPFDPQYHHSADYDWVLRAIIQAENNRYPSPPPPSSSHQQIIQSSNHQIIPSPHHPITNTHLILCAFLDGGHSKKNIGVSLRERFHSMRRHFGLLPSLASHVPIIFRFVGYFLRNKRF